MRVIRTLIVLTTVTLAMLAFVAAAAAQYGCVQVYGGGIVCPEGKVFIDKKVRNPETGSLVDNLNPNDPRFSPGQEVVFRLTVKNTGTVKLDKLEVKDTLPDFLEFVSGPGSFDVSAKTLSFVVENLEVDQSREFEVVARVTGAGNLPSDQGLFCVVNSVEARVDDRLDRDTSQLCLQKPVLGVTTLPAAGPESAVLFGLFTAISGLLGITLLRRAKALQKIG